MQVTAKNGLAGCRVLVVEDEFFIADELERALRSAGAQVIGPTPTCAEALALLGRGAVDLAVLDITLADASVYPLADALRARGIPFVFATGFGVTAVREEYRDVPRWEKPYDEAALTRALATLRRAQPSFTD